MMKYLWILVILSATTSAFGQNSFGADYLNLHCTAPDPGASPAFGDLPHPGLVPNASPNGTATVYCDTIAAGLKISVNGSAYTTFGGSGLSGSGSNPFVATSTLQLPAGTSGAPALQLGGAVDGFYQFGTHQVGMVSNGFVAANFNGTDGFNVNNATLIGWCVTGGGGTCTDGAVTASVPSNAAIGANSILQVGSGSANQTAGKVAAAGYISEGAKFTQDTGCGTVVTSSGGATAGKFTTVGSTSCTTVITMGNTATAPNGWQCSATDVTTLADAGNPHMTTSNTTTATIATGTIVSGDVISFACIGY